MSDPGTDPEAIARAYYGAIDEGWYDDLRELLGADFLHDRPDRDIEGPDEFVRFMREERPLTETAHELDGCYRNRGSVAIQGRLRHDGETLFAFVDVHAIEDGRIAHLRTYTG
jgi:ketosteroid isomerase-like protein